MVCHETQGARPVLQNPRPWHANHSFADLCVSCHLGTPTSSEKTQAHENLRSPLQDPAVCIGCHVKDGAEKAENYLLAAQTPAPAQPPSPDTHNATPANPTGASGNTANMVLLGLAGLCSLVMGGLIKKRAISPSSAWQYLKAKTWSPYVAGVLLGIVVSTAEVFGGKTLAASGGVDKLAAYLGALMFPESIYYKHIMRPEINWQVWVLFGVVLGAFLSAKLSDQFAIRWLPDEQWVPRFGASRVTRMLIAFVGAALVQFGAGIAGGCTSGLAISGGAALSPAAFIFMAAMFASGIPTAYLWYRRRP